jgi:hypothetical protein
VEKFDDQRLRFKRRVERRSSDAHLEIDPYRTSTGFGGGKISALMIGLVLLMIGLCTFAFIYLRSH